MQSLMGKDLLNLTQFLPQWGGIYTTPQSPSPFFIREAVRDSGRRG